MNVLAEKLQNINAIFMSIKVETNGFKMTYNPIDYFIELDAVIGITVHIHRRVKETSPGSAVWETETAIIKAANIEDAISIVLVHVQMWIWQETEEIIESI